MADPAGILILGALLGLAIVQHLNLRVFTRPRPAAAGPAPLRVSILVPARDEEHNIERCIRSLATQSSLELIVLDDGSTDRTGAILAGLAREFPHLRVIEGQPLPPGWRGKNWACHQLAGAARGDFLLFTDADTEHHGSVAAAVAFAEETRADLLTLMPRQVQVTAVEKLLIPLMNFMFVTFFPAFMLRLSRNPRFSAANGQFLLFRRSAYDAIGGHERIRGSIVDDLALGRRIREERLTLVTADGHELLSCRMYRSAAEIVAGFSKNLYTAVGGKPLPALAIGAMLLALFVVPPVMAALTLHPLWLLGTLLGFLLRVRSGHRTMWALAHPMAILIAAGVLWRSMLLTSGHRAVWKGRSISEV